MENRVIAAICAAPIALKAHDIGKGKSITCYPTIKDQLSNEYNYLDNKIVIAGNNRFRFLSLSISTIFNLHLAWYQF
jgi:putative intracellular protease/amidase